MDNWAWIKLQLFKQPHIPQKTRSPLEQDRLQLWSRDDTAGTVALGALSSSEHLEIKDIPGSSEGINAEHPCSSAVAVPPHCQWQHFTAEGPRGPAAVRDPRVPSHRNVASSELGQGLTRKEPFSSLTQHPLSSSKTRTSGQRLAACIVTGFWAGWMKLANKWDSGNASKIASPPTNRSSALYLKGKQPVCCLFSSPCCCYYTELWK